MMRITKSKVYSHDNGMKTIGRTYVNGNNLYVEVGSQCDKSACALAKFAVGGGADLEINRNKDGVEFIIYGNDELHALVSGLRFIADELENGIEE